MVNYRFFNKIIIDCVYFIALFHQNVSVVKFGAKKPKIL